MPPGMMRLGRGTECGGVPEVGEDADRGGRGFSAQAQGEPAGWLRQGGYDRGSNDRCALELIQGAKARSEGGVRGDGTEAELGRYEIMAVGSRGRIGVLVAPPLD